MAKQESAKAQDKAQKSAEFNAAKDAANLFNLTPEELEEINKKAEAAKNSPVQFSIDQLGYDPDSDCFYDPLGEIIDTVNVTGELSLALDALKAKTLKRIAEAEAQKAENESEEQWIEQSPLPQLFKFGREGKGKPCKPGSFVVGEFYGVGEVRYFGQATEMGKDKKPIFNEDGSPKYSSFAALYNPTTQQWNLVGINGNLPFQLHGLKHGTKVKIQWLRTDTNADGQKVNIYLVERSAKYAPSLDTSVNYHESFDQAMDAYRASK